MNICATFTLYVIQMEATTNGPVRAVCIVNKVAYKKDSMTYFLVK